MTAPYTLFLSPYIVAFPDNVSDPSFSKYQTTFTYQGRYNITDKKVTQVLLDNNETQAITLPSSAVLSSWVMLVIQVEGLAQLETTGKDLNGTTSISGFVPVYGTSVLPGIIVLSTFNILTLTLRGQADNTKINVFAGLSAGD